MENLFSFKREHYGIKGQWVHGLYVDEISPINPIFPKPPKILLVHGAAGSSTSYFPLMYLLAKQGYHVIAPNLPGHGKNHKITMRNLHVWDYMDNLRDFCRTFNPDILMGHSMGSLLVQKMAIEYNPKALVLLSAIPPLEVKWKMKKAFARYFFSILYGLPYLLGFTEPLNRAFNKYFIYTCTPKETVLSLFSSQDTDNHAGEEIPSLYFDVFNKNFASIAKDAIKAPIFIANGELDPLMPIETEKAIAEYYSCPFYIQPKSGHLFVIEEGIEETTQQIVSFLNPLLKS